MIITNQILKLAGVKELPAAIIMENAPIHKDTESIGTVKHVLIAAIKFYTKEHKDAESTNLKHEYRSIIDHLDGILGHIKTGSYKDAKAQWTSLDTHVKNQIVHKVAPKDNQYTVVSYFEPDTDVDESYTLLEYSSDPHDQAVSKDIRSLELLAHKLAHHQAADMENEKHDHNDVAVAKIILKLEKILADLKKAQHKDEVNDQLSETNDEEGEYRSEYGQEKEEGDESILGESTEIQLDEKVDVEYMDDFIKDQAAAAKKEEKDEKSEMPKVPANVIKDIKDQIKAIEKEAEYTTHLSNDAQIIHDERILNVLNQLIEYFKVGCEYSIKMAATVAQSLDTADRHQIPISVWKFLSINMYPSLGGDLMNRFKEVKLKNENVSEKWKQEVHTPESKKGMFKGRSKSDLQSELNSLKASGPHKKGSAAYTKQKELIFAIRAKSNWGKV